MLRSLALPALAMLALATPAYAQDGARWTLDTQGEAATLNHGTNEPEDIHETLSCRPGSHEVRFYFHLDTRPGTPRVRATLASGAVRAVVNARATPEEMYGGAEITGALPARSPVMAAFRRTGRIRFTADNQGKTPRPARPAMVARFLTVCG